MRLKDKGVLITGGASGIGRGMAMALAKEGAKIAIADMDAKAGAQTLEELRQFSPEAIFIEANLRETDKLASLVEKTVAAFGKLDVLINNAHASRQKTFMTGQTLQIEGGHYIKYKRKSAEKCAFPFCFFINFRQSLGGIFLLIFVANLSQLLAYQRRSAVL